MYISAYALGDPSVTVEQVTPAVFPAGALFPSEVSNFVLRISFSGLFCLSNYPIIKFRTFDGR